MRTGGFHRSLNRARPVLAAVIVAALGQATGARAAPAAPPVLAWDRPETQGPGQAPALRLVSPAIRPDGPMPVTYTADGKNISPPLAWSGVPANARTLVLMVEDPDSESPRPAVHWLAYNIPAAVKGLSRGVRNAAEPTSPLGMLQGWNYHGSVGYSGPRPPPDDAPHHYHFEIFAVDRVLRIGPGAQPARVLGAMAGHVVARGGFVTTYGEPKAKPETTPDPSQP